MTILHRILGITVFGASLALAQEPSLTYKEHIFPIIEKYCLRCHLEENDNPSGLAMDSFELLMKGGKNGNTVVPGKPEESILYRKLLSDPPFGKQMPRNRKKLSAEEIGLIFEWIRQGARKE